MWHDHKNNNKDDVKIATWQFTPHLVLRLQFNLKIHIDKIGQIPENITIQHKYEEKRYKSVKENHF